MDFQYFIQGCTCDPASREKNPAFRLISSLLHFFLFHCRPRRVSESRYRAKETRIAVTEKPEVIVTEKCLNLYFY